MTAKEKAGELINKFFHDMPKIKGYDDVFWQTAKQMCFIGIDEILELENFSVEGREFWSEVKQELTNL